jgi:cation diffusion facilitator CzcD-associated flavoprotein CzcO
MRSNRALLDSRCSLLSDAQQAGDKEPAQVTSVRDTQPAPVDAGTVRDVGIAIIGSGFAGLGMAIALKRRGETGFVVLERAGDVGGTWRDNTYPGAACDVQSNLYSFSFAPNPDWGRSYSEQPEIQAYLQRTADRFDVRRHCVFGADVTAARWDDVAQRWLVSTTAGEFRARVLVSAAGALADPTYPDIPGLGSFAGTVMHSARWDADHDLTGERVAVIGTGASAVQVVPAIQPVVGSIAVYQRTPAWVVPRTDHPVKPVMRRLYRFVPGLQKGIRGALYLLREFLVLGMAKKQRFLRPVAKLARTHLHRQVRDPKLRAALTPDYTIGCKRILISNDYFPAVAAPNAELVTAAIAEIRPHSIVTTDGVERPTDTIVLATGFHVTDLPIARKVRGRDGRSLADVWSDGMVSNRSSTVAGFPNLFLLVGPNVGVGHTSMVYMIESQVAYVDDALKTMDAEGLAVLETTAEAQEAYRRLIAARSRGTVWLDGGCSSWYLDQHGHNTTLWPDFTFRFRRLTRRLDRENYVGIPASADRPEVAA